MNLAINKTQELNRRLMASFRNDFTSMPLPEELIAWAEPKFKEFFQDFTKEELIEVAIEFNVGLMMEAFRVSAIKRLTGL